MVIFVVYIYICHACFLRSESGLQSLKRVQVAPKSQDLPAYGLLVAFLGVVFADIK